MPDYSLRIHNHRVIGHPYIPICKFQLTTPSHTEQSAYINPPLISQQQIHNQKGNLFVKQNDKSYGKQFPVVFDNVVLRENEQIMIRLIELTRNGREKQIGFSKIVINSQVVGRNTRHKIVKMEQLEKGQKDNQQGHVISIVQICVYPLNAKGQAGNVQQSKVNGKAVTYSRESLKQQHKLIQSNQYTQQQDSQYQQSNPNTSRQQLDEDQKFDWHQSHQTTPQQSHSLIHANKQSYSLIHNNNVSLIKQRQRQNSQQSFNTNSHARPRRYQRVMTEQPSQEKSLAGNQSREKLTGKIYKQKVADNEQLHSIEQKQQKHRRRLKYILNSNQFSQGNPLIQEQRSAVVKQVTKKEQRLSSRNLSHNATKQQHYKRTQTQPNAITIAPQPQPLIQYFVSDYQTNHQGCNRLSNLNIVYQSSIKQFSPKYITFLTYDLYQKIARINCEKLQSKFKIIEENQDQQPATFLLQTRQGKFRQPQVYGRFSRLKVYLPKYCLVLRVEIILEDETVYVGTLANQQGTNVKTCLHLKKSNTTLNTINESLNIVVNISDIEQPIHPQRHQHLNPTNSHNHLIQKLTPSRRKQTQQQSLEYFPTINSPNNRHNNNRHYNSLHNGAQQNLNTKLNQLSVEKTLNTITAYKICLSPMTGPVIQSGKYQQLNKGSEYRTGENYHKGQNVDREFYHEQLQRAREMLIRENTPYEGDEEQYFNEDRSMKDLQTHVQTASFKKTLTKDLPKIIIQRSNHKDIQNRKQALKNIRQQIAINTKSKSPAPEKLTNKNQIRLQFFKKVLGHKYSPYQNHRSSVQKLNNDKLKIHLDRDSKEERLRHKKLSKLPYVDFSSTIMFSKQRKKTKSKKHGKHSTSPHKQTTKFTYARELRCMKHNAETNPMNGKQKNEHQNVVTYRLLVKKIEFIKLVQPAQNTQQSQTRRKANDQNDESDSTVNNNSFIQQPQSFQIFLKLYNESRRQKEFITSSQTLSYAWDQPQAQRKRQQDKTKVQLNYLTCSWVLKDEQFLFKNINLDELITVDAYGDLTAVDNHEFMGKCVFSVQEILYMQHQKKITGYMVKKKNIESHVTIHFDIVENL